MSAKIVLRIFLVVVVLSVWLYWDFSQAERHSWSPYPSFKPLSAFDAMTSASTKVAIVRSDDPELPHPIPITDAAITYDEIESMVRRAIELAGGFDWVIESGDMVLIKPNIVDPEPPGSGEVTDVRVVKALIKIIDEIDHGNMRIVVGEGSPRPMDYEMKYQSKYSSPVWEKIWDAAGYQELLTDPYLAGIDLRFSNLNGSPAENPWQDLVEVEVPGGVQASPQGGTYFIHKDVLDADVFITVPVMKIHEPGITVALKNQIGLAPSTIYGFSKTAGTPQDGYRHKLIHSAQAPKYWKDKEIVDLCSLAKIKYAVVDAIACLEREKTASRSGGVITNLVRMNTIVAGADPVAVDHVCTRLMGLNPDDIEHITLAERVGLGTNDPDDIYIVGADLDQTKKKFIKTPAAEGDFGQTNRVWLLKGPYGTEGIDDAINYPFIDNEAGVRPVAGQDGWSEPIYFTDDRIDLRNYFALSSGDYVVSYALSYFDAPKDQEAELWVGSDDALIIYINGVAAYTYQGTRSFSDGQCYSVKVKAPVKAGENTLLVKALQKYGRYDFSLNLCEPETNPNFDGNRIWGLKFKTASDITSVQQHDIATAMTFDLYDAYPNPFNALTTISYTLYTPQLVRLKIFDILGREVKTLVSEHQPEGKYAVHFDASHLGSGTYFYVLEAGGDRSGAKKIVLVK
ncbi:hypothetical protein A2V82_12115 [candidate division KSB1 bacterium RBG_16_48_16]|nr:MAG: hypothetical protein A2V82_12115 [candidate division KSB1 bacterium RBG_16_48_16]